VGRQHVLDLDIYDFRHCSYEMAKDKKVAAKSH